MHFLIMRLLIPVLFIGMLSCSRTVPSHEIERLNKLKSALAPYVLPPKFDEERVKHFNLKNEDIGKLADILEPHDIKLQISEQALQQSFPIASFVFCKLIVHLTQNFLICSGLQ